MSQTVSNYKVAFFSIERQQFWSGDLTSYLLLLKYLTRIQCTKLIKHKLYNLSKMPASSQSYYKTLQTHVDAYPASMK